MYMFLVLAGDHSTIAQRLHFRIVNICVCGCVGWWVIDCLCMYPDGLVRFEERVLLR